MKEVVRSKPCNGDCRATALEAYRRDCEDRYRPFDLEPSAVEHIVCATFIAPITKHIVHLVGSDLTFPEFECRVCGYRGSNNRAREAAGLPMEGDSAEGGANGDGKG